MVQCEIKYDDNPNGIFYSGQTMSGVVQLRNDKPRKIRAISLRIVGLAVCAWGENTQYSEHLSYLDNFSYLIAAETELSAGIHHFNFSCALPPQLPTSFETYLGNIRYQVKVEVEREWKTNIRFSFTFTVIKALDLNLIPELRNPQKTEITKKFLLSSKTLFMSAEIPMSGYVAGQSVEIAIRINNETSKDVLVTQVFLVQIITYNSQAPKHSKNECEEILAETHEAGVPKKSKANINATLLLPSVAPTSLEFCQILKVSYEIHVSACISGNHRSPRLKLPLTIGTVPWRNNLNHHSLLPTIPFVDWGFQQPSTSNAQPSGEMSPPPSYQEAVKSLSAEVDTDSTSEKPFSPLYPVFNFDDSTPALNVQPPMGYSIGLFDFSSAKY